MKLHLLGIIYDGTDRVPSVVPISPAKTLVFPAATSLTLQLDVVRPDGTAPDLTGYTATWSCRLLSNQYGRLPGFTKAVSPAAAPAPRNQFLFTLVPADTKFLVPNRYVYDVWIVSGAGERNQVVPLSALALTPALALT